MSDMFDRLRAPFPADIVSWRVGSTTKDKSKGMALAYIDARDVMSRLDEVIGPANWQDRYEFHGPRTVCYLSIRIDGEWVTKADGAGDSDVEAEKGAISDALKRSAVKWGVGRYLYDLPSPWVKLTDFKGIDPGELPALRGLLARSAATPAARAQPEPPPSGRKSSAQAKKDGDDEAIKQRINALQLPALAAFEARFDEHTATMPRGWLDPIRDMIEHRREELISEQRAAEGNAELDGEYSAVADFRSSGLQSVAGHGSGLAAAE